MNIKNLETLSKYLKSGKLKADFDMENFTPRGNEYSATTCGSVGCAVGHGPYAGIEKFDYEGWVQYSMRVLKLEKNEWIWCFSEKWARVDNTPLGAAARIDYMLQNGLQENWKEQLEGKAELCY